MQKRLYRSKTERMLFGVCGGIAEYFSMDPVWVRIIFVLLTFANGFGILVYIVMAIVVPEEGSKATTPEETVRENVIDIKETAEKIGNEIHTTFHEEEKPNVPERSSRSPERRNTLGIILILIGLIFLLGSFNLFQWISWKYIWPGILIAVGLIIIFYARRNV